MTGTLALIGGGEFVDGCMVDDELLAASGATRVALLATGWAYENPKRAVESARSWFGSKGVEVHEVPVYSRADAMDHANITAVAEASFILITGVSPMHIKSVIKQTPLFDAMVGAWRGGAVLAGSNAGADVLCDPMVDIRGGAFTLGLGIAANVSVIARSDTWSPDKVRRTIDLASANVVVVEVPERSALVHDGNGWRSIGAGVVAHRGGRTIALSELPTPS